jgi:hypothetical protein
MLFLAAECSFRWCAVSTGGEEVDVERCGRLSVRDGVLHVACGFVRTSWVVLWRGMNVPWVVIGESESETALGDRRVCAYVV